MDSDASAVLLDIDGTLVDSTYHHAVAWHRAFARVGEVVGRVDQRPVDVEEHGRGI